MGRLNLDKPIGVDQLSAREKQVIELLELCSSTQIGERLGISRETVKTHMKRIFDKLNVNNKTSAVLVYRGVKEVAPTLPLTLVKQTVGIQDLCGKPQSLSIHF